jgi:hypothetical protein
VIVALNLIAFLALIAVFLHLLGERHRLQRAIARGAVLRYRSAVVISGPDGVDSILITGVHLKHFVLIGCIVDDAVIRNNNIVITDNKDAMHGNDATEGETQ